MPLTTYVDRTVVEPSVVHTAVQGATDTACMILRIDNIVTAKEPDEFGM